MQSSTPYPHPEAYYQDCIRFFRLRFLALLSEEETDTEAGSSVEQMALLLMKEYAFFSPNSGENHHTATLLAAHIAARFTQNQAENMPLPDALLAARFGLTAQQRALILLCYLTAIDTRFAPIISFLRHTQAGIRPTYFLAARLLCTDTQTPFTLLDVLLSLPRRAQLLFQPTEDQSLLLHDSCMRFLSAPIISPDCFPAGTQLFLPGQSLPTLTRYADLPLRLASLLSDTSDASPRVLYLHGAVGVGKKTIFQALCAQMNCAGLLFSIADFPSDPMAKLRLLDSLSRCSLLYHAYLCFYTDEDMEDTPENISSLRELLINVLDYLPFAAICTTKKLPLRLHHGIHLHTVVLERPTAAEQLQFWQDYSRELPLAQDIQLEQFTSKFCFTIGQIRASLRMAQEDMQLHGQAAITSHMLSRACFAQAAHRLARTAVLIPPTYTWNDLAVPPKQARLLHEACSRVLHHHTVFTTWGYDKKLSYGRGLTMLFAGPSGTGKTLAAQVVAGMLDLELYRVHIPKIVSKYIGETEKNLDAIFQDAKNSNVILFFDETEALFGKRTQVASSNDRYANIEVAYLLQQLEAHEGVVIMTTNLLDNIDEAFLRRISYIIDFPLPDAAVRKQLWRHAFPAQTPLAEDIDFDFLAESFELSGGSIKNITLGAVFLAAAEHIPISMRHILRALQQEMEKDNKIISPSAWGIYAPLEEDC